MPSRAIAQMDTKPLWSDEGSLPRIERLQHNEHVDVVIVGAGITGLTAAYLLTAAGKSVAVLERARCVEIDTGHTSAHLTMVTDTRLAELVRRFGTTHAQAVWDAGLAAIAQIDRIARDHQIECDFEWVDGYLHRAIGATDQDDAASFEVDATLARELGFDAELVHDVPLYGGAGARFGGQARFHPRRYLTALVRVIKDAGGHIYEHSEADEFCAKPLSVTVNGHIVTCEDIVLATHDPLVGVSRVANATLLQTKLALYTSYVVAGRVPKGRIPDALYWDTAAPYHYTRLEPQKNHDLVLFGGEDHKTGQFTETSACYERLASAIRAVVPEVHITHRWSGQVIETPDGLPYIGKTADHQYAATGFGGNGMTFGTLGAMMATDAILARRNPWTDLFDIDRKAIRHGLWDYVKENADYPYYQIRDRLVGAEGRSLRAVKRGEGKIIDRNGSKVAVFRDLQGATTICSAQCTHMGCQVAWNQAERTWDCPCHGSRFKPTGEVISGPAESPLTPE